MTKKRNIVLIDDNKVYISLISDILKAKGHDVLCISDSKGANRFIEDIRNRLLDLQIVLDYFIDKKTRGDELAKRIKEANRNTFIVMISAYVGEEAKIIDELLNDKTIDVFIEKPFEFNKLYNVLNINSI